MAFRATIVYNEEMEKTNEKEGIVMARGVYIHIPFVIKFVIIAISINFILKINQWMII